MTNETAAVQWRSRSVGFTVPGVPVGKGRPIAGKAFIGGGRTAVRLRTPEKTIRYESDVRVFAAQAMAGRPLFDGPVRLVLNVAVPIAASWSMKRQTMAKLGEIRPTVKPDASNVLKAIEDAMNGVVWNDDVQVVELQIGKYYSTQPEVRVFVETINARGSQ